MIRHAASLKSSSCFTASRSMLGGRYIARPAVNVRRPFAAQAAHKDCTPAEVQDLMAKNGYKYVDVRTTEEYSAGHVPGAISVPILLRGGLGMNPNPQFQTDVASNLKDKSETIIVGCKSGMRSLAAIDVMTKDGYTSLINVKGGFDGWLAAGLPVEK
mmetsp:Transcript_6040/g.13162  ORF Transcript_6040/g.13162 Transcript_6040/m.13162 type:complete len:158 (+) Transcript_6040:82-555(+)|eukprot:CAMPEP_0202894522 /NCGR_PEP_ID=MMETSP1392-20130828/3913_1 /ASSEMBLY_ACC=CAM_ASM_000868 /TAXON_ID=225041 /ORGANISM="Chlamydomonas chlamydogama, Strain SAG 11-48b" /LENGTH=157 /DNA_ID=CAMNT_0049579249 /DNA_START=65 /DNA_END=538 /DNA_ORIENTATION=-